VPLPDGYISLIDCPVCGVRHTGLPTYGRFRGYCWPCRDAARLALARKRRAQRRANRTCEHCGATFTPTRADGRYCSGACRQAAYRERGGGRPRRTARAVVTVELIRHPDQGYETPDGRWRVQHQPEVYCAPRGWWWVTDTHADAWPEFAVRTLQHAKDQIAARLKAEAETGYTA